MDEPQTALVSVQHSSLWYPIVEFDSRKKIMMLEDRDTGKTFNWWPGTDKRSCTKIFKAFGFEIAACPTEPGDDGD